MDLINALFDSCKGVARPIIAIDGPAGAGKTTLAEHLSAALSLKYKCTTLHMDDLYNGWQNAFDHHLIDALIGAATAHQNSRPYSLSRYLWNQNQFSEVQAVKEAELLIFEGVGSSQRAIRPQLTATIWIDIDEAAGLERVLRRDGDAISAQMREWLRTQAQHFALEESKDAADFVLTT